jgi:hypothetical protein
LNASSETVRKNEMNGVDFENLRGPKTKQRKMGVKLQETTIKEIEPAAINL